MEQQDMFGDGGLKPRTLEAENLYGLRRVYAEFDARRAAYVVTGTNGAGKTSFVDAIWFALLGPTGTHRTKEQTIRDGEEEAYSEVTLNNGVRVRRIAEQTPKGTEIRLELTNADGSRIPSPQTFLKRVCGEMLGVDPYEFARSKPAEQGRALLDAVGLYHVVTETERQRRALYDERTHVGRERERARAFLETLGPLDDEAPDDEVSLQELSDLHTAAWDAHLRQQRLAQQLDGVNKELARVVEEIARLQELADGLRAERDQKAAELERSEVPDIAAIQQQMAAVEETNKRVRANRERKGAIAEYDSACRQYDEMTATLRGLEENKRAQVLGATMPHPRLSVDPESLEPLYDGVPLGAASFAQQLEVGCAVAMGGRATLKLVTIEHGGELDTRTLERIEQMAAERGYLLIVQRVAEAPPEGAIHIVAGEVAGDG